MKKHSWLFAAPLLMIAVVSYAQIPPSNAATAPALAAPKWEYTRIQYNAVVPGWELAAKISKQEAASFVAAEKKAEEEFMKKLNASGAEGWELVSLDRQSYQMPGSESNTVTAYLKRTR